MKRCMDSNRLKQRDKLTQVGDYLTNPGNGWIPERKETPFRPPNKRREEERKKRDKLFNIGDHICLLVDTMVFLISDIYKLHANMVIVLRILIMASRCFNSHLTQN